MSSSRLFAKLLGWVWEQPWKSTAFRKPLGQLCSQNSYLLEHEGTPKCSSQQCPTSSPLALTAEQPLPPYILPVLPLAG